MRLPQLAFLQNYRIGIALSLAVIAALFGALVYNYAVTGQFVNRGIDFTGGTQAAAELSRPISPAEVDAVESAVSSAIAADARVKLTQPVLQGASQVLIIESKASFDEGKLRSVLERVGIQSASIGISLVGAALSESFWAQALWAISFAFAAMAAVVFFTFRNPIASLIIVVAVAADMLAALASTVLLNIEFSLATLAATLMIIGYSGDTNILLTSRVLRQPASELESQIRSSFRTGFMMTIAALAAVTVLFVVSTSQVLDQIAIVLSVGLLADLLFTWVFNVSLLRWYISRRARRAVSKEEQA